MALTTAPGLSDVPTPTRAAGRLASLGLLAILIAVPGLTLWTTILTYRAGQAAQHATEVSNALNEARYDVCAEESLERKYRLEPGPAVRSQHRATADQMVAALQRAGDLGADTAMIKTVLSNHAQYLVSIDRMFAAIDADDIAEANRLDQEEVDPSFDGIEQQVLGAAHASRADAVRHLAILSRLQTGVLIATPIVFTIAAGFVVFFWGVLRTYRRGAREALLREADAAQQRERRFRALVQNASDVILICNAAGTITYQSPAAEAGWGFANDALLGQTLPGLVHPDAQPALAALWQQLQTATDTLADASRTIELLIGDNDGTWRFAQLVLTNLLQETSVAGVVATIRDVGERKAFEQQLTEKAFYDSLTGLPNRLLFRDRLEQALVRCGRRGTRAGLIFLDLDNFKLINDSLGHAVGDELLTEAAARLRCCLRAEDTVARLGGDEFVIVLQDLVTDADALLVVDAILHQFGRLFTLGGRELTVTLSMGVALTDKGLEQADNLLRNADVAMYRAKSNGKGCHVIFDPSMHIDALARLELENDLRRAIYGGELRLHYQPIVHMTSGRIGEVEALVRWQHPTRGLVAPADFIPIAEETGLIIPLGQWVLEEACRQVMSWHEEFADGPPMLLSVNLSPRQFQQPTLVDEVARALATSGLSPQYLKLEITEGVILHDTDATIRRLWQLRDLGIKLAVDDFGTGYSSLSYLKRLPLDVLKIDRSFISGLGQDSGDSAIVRAIISLAKSLDLAVTGEGVETEQQAALLGALGCDRGQGYFYGRPIDGLSTTSLLRRSQEAVVELA